MKTRSTLMAILIAGLLTACGGGGGGGSTDNGNPDEQLPPELVAVPDPCTLVTSEEAAAALGAPVEPCDLRGQEQFYATATYLTPAEYLGQLDIDVAAGGQQVYDELKSDAAADNEFAEVAGVGDAAFFHRRHVDADITFVKGPFVVTISVGFVTGPPPQSAAVGLAATVAGRLTT